MDPPNRITVECTEVERGGCEVPAMMALLVCGIVVVAARYIVCIIMAAVRL